VPISVESKYRLDPKRAMDYVDENTIGVYVILGSTYTGHYEPVKEMSDVRVISVLCRRVSTD
jgi:glutamate decarboxylase